MQDFTAKTLHLAETHSLWRQAIVDGGVSVPATTPLRDYVTKTKQAIASGTGGTSAGDGWTRPTDRPAVPTVNENEIYMLFGVISTGPNDYAITLTATGGYKADWGDGTIDTVASAVKCEHRYDYASLTVTPNAEGIKWVWIKFTPVSGSFTVINHNVRHSLRPVAGVTGIFVPQVYEIYLNAPNVENWNWNALVYTRFYNLEIFNWQGTNKLTSAYFFLFHSYNLRQLNIYTGGCTSFSNFLQYCYSFNQVMNIDTSKGTDFIFFMGYCYSFNQALNIDTSKCTEFTNFLSYCYSFNQPLNLSTSNGIDFTYFMNQCVSFMFNLTVDLAKATTPIGTSFIGTQNRAQTGLRLFNMGSAHTSLTISNSSLGVNELVALFNDLYDRSSTTAGTITITNVAGASQLTEEQVNIAKLKNWGVTGAPSF